MLFFALLSHSSELQKIYPRPGSSLWKEREREGDRDRERERVSSLHTGVQHFTQI